MNVKLLAVAMVATSLALFACTPSQQPGVTDTAIPGATFDKTGQELRITVYVHKSVAELNRAMTEIRKENGLPPYPVPVDGMAAFSTNSNVCEIHVAPITEVGFAVFGHELAHCLYGGFHPEG